MRAIICTKYGTADVLELRDVEKPVPRDNEVLIKVYTTTCHIGDVRIRRFDVPLWQRIPFRLFLGIMKPRQGIQGMEAAGVVEAVGKKVERLKAGDEVFASAGFVFGAHAEYLCLPADSTDVKKGLVAIKPTNMSFEEAAAGAATGGLTALSALEKANIQSGQKVLVYGASGSVGVFAVQLANYFGAEVTAVCSTANFEMVESLGATKTIDYTQEDFTKNGESYDVIIDAVDKLAVSRGKKSVKKNGFYLNVVKDSEGKITLDKLNFLKELIEAGKIKTIIDKIYTLEQLADAHRYVEKGHKKGHVVIRVAGSDC